MRINVSSLLKRTPRDGSCFSSSSFLSSFRSFGIVASLAGRNSSSSSSPSSSNGKIGGSANSWRTSDGRRTTAARTAVSCSSYSTNASSLTSSSSQSSWFLPIVGTVGLTFGCVTLGMEYQKRTEKALRQALGGGGGGETPTEAAPTSTTTTTPAKNKEKKKEKKEGSSSSSSSSNGGVKSEADLLFNLHNKARTVFVTGSIDDRLSRHNSCI